MPMTSGASTTTIRWRSMPGWRASSASMLAVGAHQLELESRGQLRQGAGRAFDLGMRGLIAPHRIERDADHA